ncbi:hypothetical protein AVEN_152865-1 [Araneus ventricosus]|uniref:Uncharacterized protein n=1 Tax=Araneus ventricosus TaxID=182803 RepID=A0A4Y2AD58_ARAVE|nr:hypothetical protein AVEN_152865-1 [Araneus ventricosus]
MDPSVDIHTRTSEIPVRRDIIVMQQYYSRIAYETSKTVNFMQDRVPSTDAMFKIWGEPCLQSTFTARVNLSSLPDSFWLFLWGYLKSKVYSDQL